MLNIHTKKLGNVAVLGLQGQLVNGQTEILRNAVQNLTGVSTIKLDLANVNAVDAGGLGVLLALREQAEKQGIRFELMNVNKRVGMVMSMTRLDTVFRITSGIGFLPSVGQRQRLQVPAFASCA